MIKRKKGILRIIGGKWRRRLLSFPDIEELRPTHDRVRETLFNWLKPYINGASCLDLFAGSGALGFEALSRGAKRVTLVDSNKVVINTLKNTAKQFNLTEEEVEFICGKCPDDLLSLTYSPYHIVFIDPPFNKYPVNLIINWLDLQHCLIRNTLLYFETTLLMKFNLPGWQVMKKGNTKSVSYFLLKKV